MNYIIREMGESEYAVLDDFLYEAIFIPEGVSSPSREIIYQPELQVYVDGFGTKDGDYAFVADLNGKIVGAVWTRIMNDYGHIDNDTPSFAISLYKEYRNKGIGTALMKTMLQIFKFPNVERATYDRCEHTADNQIFPVLGAKAVGDITAADIQKLLNDLMADDYSYSTVKKTYNLLAEFFRYQKKENIVSNNPIEGVTMLKKANFLSAQGKEIKPAREEVQIFSPEEIESIRTEAFSTFSDGTRKYQQPAAYFLMLNTGLRTGEVLGLKNSDVDLENRMLYVRHVVKEVSKRNGAEKQKGKELITGKPKSATSKRVIPLNATAIEMIIVMCECYIIGTIVYRLRTDFGGGFTIKTNISFHLHLLRCLKLIINH